jgi:GntR family transcriptional regulator
MADDPLYRRIAEDLRQQIVSGRLGPGSKLPAEEKLKKRFDASRNTIRDAVKFLIALGLVETRAGQGTFVTTPPVPLVTTLTADRVTGLGGGEGAAYFSEAAERNPRTSGPRVELQTATAEIAVRLGVPEGTPLISRHEQRFISRQDRQDRQEQPASGPDGREEHRGGGTSPPEGAEPSASMDGLAPWSLQTSFYPRSLAAKGADRLFDAVDITQGTVKYLEETLEIKQTGYRDWITVRAPDPNEMSFFRLPSDGRVPVFEIFRTAFDQAGKPMRVTVTIFPADRNQFIIDVGDVPARQYKAAE